jgi:hypothetical protein
MYKQAPLANILVLFRLISLLACLPAVGVAGSP